MLGAWQYWTGSGWSDGEAEAGPTLPIDGSVVRVGGRYVMVGLDHSVPFSPDVVVASARPRRALRARAADIRDARTGEDGGNLYTYGVYPHPELSGAGGGFPLSYDVNTFDGSLNYSDVTIYRPRFIRVTV